MSASQPFAILVIVRSGIRRRISRRSTHGMACGVPRVHLWLLTEMSQNAVVYVAGVLGKIENILADQQLATQQLRIQKPDN
jgi:hypothetical protein